MADSEVLLGAGDLDGHVGEDRRGFEDVIGIRVFGVRNREGEEIFDLYQSKELNVVNAIFRKEREKKIAYKSRGTETQIDFSILREERQIRVKGNTAIPGETCSTCTLC